jgi:cyclopropane fatty-acyl-phospholipid synthase-like methyltransferase
VPPRAHEAAPHQYDRLIAYYEEAGLDFAQWSAGFNMHFGYYRAGMNPLGREAMLNEQNRQVLQRLQLPVGSSGALVDLGCGAGATVRTAAAEFPHAGVLGITVVPWQVEFGNAWNRRIGVHPRARLELRDYTSSRLPSASADGAWAIESACHAAGADKAPFIREAARILKPGARLVVADGFLKNRARRLGPIASRLHDQLCRSFVLPQLAQVEDFTEALARHGFTEVTLEDISWRVAPSALQAPALVAWFALKTLLHRETFGEWRVNNLRGSVVSAALGAIRWKVGYFLISALRA